MASGTIVSNEIDIAPVNLGGTLNVMQHNGLTIVQCHTTLPKATGVRTSTVQATLPS